MPVAYTEHVTVRTLVYIWLQNEAILVDFVRVVR